MIRLILDTERRALLNYWRVLGESRKIVYILIGLLLMLILLPLVTTLLFSITASIDQGYLDLLLLMLSLASAIILVLLSIHFIIKDMILSGSIALYMSYPISAAELFYAKFIRHNLFYSTSILLPLSVVVGAALAARDGQWMLMLNSIIYFIVLGMFFTSISFGLVFLTANMMPVKKVSEILAFLGGMSFLLIYIIMFIVADSFTGILAMFPEIPISFSGILYDYSPVAGILGPILMIVAAIAIILLTKFIVVRAIDRVGITEGHSTGRRKAGRSSISHPVIMLACKDMKLSFRNIRELAVLLPIYVLPLVLVYFSSPAEAGAQFLVMEGSQLVSTAAGGALVTALYIGAHHTARDAEHFQMLQVLPVPGSQLAFAKYIFNILATVPFLMIIFTITWFFSTAGVDILLYMLACILLVCLAAVPVGMLIGSSNPVVSRKNPSRRLDTASNIIITMIMFVVFMMISMLPFWLEGNVMGVRQGLIIINILAICAVAAWFVLGRVAGRYDEGFKITYKD
ncbi:hypothetical protein ACFOLA_02860 [Salinicoccus hispanicus]|uniref:Uncharacterized protein n=1 Tax=Salinicoccus hispanicus TaxID=157225 RepID=A0A6N8U0S2_9STAP|nr:hypothetical protein [Salinicoccus hispanicus]MXQ50526.1 hypothetical protein [Salinicoccus hispanicus]